jgi:[NiFe] hydrogenase assembly HybE family chaperone
MFFRNSRSAPKSRASLEPVAMNRRDDHPRVLALLDRFRHVDAAMRDLPLYNAKVPIEAIGFRPFGDDALIGVLLTPWFMNLIVLPIEPTPMDMAAIGKASVIELPAGKRTFVVGGDAAIGLYKALSLHSPVLNFTLPGQAQAEAQRQLATLMAPGVEEAPASSNSAKFDRRALLFGRRSGPGTPPAG